MPSFNLITFYDDRLAALGDLTAQVADNYARRRGYRFRCHRVPPSSGVHLFWHKINIILDELSNADHTLWLDADVLIVGGRSLESLVSERCDLMLSSDGDGLCCGLMLVRNSGWSRSLLSAWRFLQDVDGAESWRYEARNLHDQTTLKCLLKNFPSVRSRVGLVCEEVVLNPKSSFSSDPFAMHYWSSAGDIEGIANRVRRFETEGWNRDCFYPWSNSPDHRKTAPFHPPS